MIAKVQLHMHAVFLCYIFHYNLFNLFLHSSLDRSKYQSGGIICGCIQLALYNLTVYHRELYVTTITIMKCHNHLKVLIKYQRVTNLISFSCFSLCLVLAIIQHNVFLVMSVLGRKIFLHGACIRCVVIIFYFCSSAAVF